MKNDRPKLTAVETESMVEYIRKGEFEKLQQEPYFSSAKIKGETAAKLAKMLKYSFDEEDPNVQEKLYLNFDKIMNGLAKYRYEQNKNHFQFRSVNQINSYLIKIFEKMDDANQTYYLKNLADTFNQKISDKEYYNICLEKINILYYFYCQNKNLPYEITTEFYNQILNKQEETYIKNQKQSMIEKLTRTLPYTTKKEKSRLINVKLRKVDKLLAEKKYEQLGITEEELKKIVSNYDEEINSTRKIVKEKFILNKTQLKKINEQFLVGNLTEESLLEIIPESSKEVRATILNKYTLIKSNFLNRISVTEDELPSLVFGYHYNNYKIGTMENTYKTIVNIITTISEAEAEDILFPGEVSKEIQELLPLVGYLDDFSIEEMITILRNYSVVISHMKKEGLLQEESVEAAISQFFNFFTIAEAYESADDITIWALGKETLEQIRYSDKLTSKRPQDYLNIYEGALAREYTYLPRVSGEFDNYYYESGNDADRERLLIGKNCSFSCIGPGGAGEEAYEQALVGHSADVIMIKDKNTNEFIARSLCFRRGNYVVLAPIHGKQGLEESLYKPEFLSAIGTQMIKKSIETGDTLEYIFISPDGRFLDDTYPIIEDTYLMDPFPHADLDVIGYLIGSTKEPSEVEIDSIVMMPVIYKTKREVVKGKETITNEELTRIKALDILLTEDIEEREEKSREFEPVNKNKYDDIYKGQDWYIAIIDEKIVEEVILPTEHESQLREIATLKERIDMVKTTNDNVLMENNRGSKR